jgi:DNA-binding NtrC family response regulator
MEDETVRQTAAAVPMARAFDVFVDVGGKRTAHRIAPSTPGPVLIGHSVVCQIRLPDKSVSRRHAALDLVETGLRFTDLGSTNGSFLGSTRLYDVVLQGGEQIRLGSAMLRVQVAPSSAEEALVSTRQEFGRVRGESAALRRLFPVFERLAATNLPAVIEGETGTGKEVLAESIHSEGPRASGPYVVFDCTTAHASLVESELFGHEKGAFTGAIARRRGVFELASGGTLLIDEIGDLDLALQPKLLRVLERGEIRRVGGNEPLAVDVRILAATRRNLDQEVLAGRFRDDLFHRLSVARVELPPLRKRKDDIEMLARMFWSHVGGAPGDFPFAEVATWKERDWPGNIRELRNAVARLFAMGISPPPEVTDDDDSLDAALALPLPLPEVRRIVGERLERRYVRQMLERHGGNATRAAEASGIALRHFHRIKARTQ